LTAKTISFLFLLLFISLTFTKVAAQKSKALNPNIVLIIGDDIGADDIGCYGNQQVKTPIIDKIAREGLRFTNAFLTTSSCSPSRCSIISGRYPHNSGAAELHTPLPPEVSIFPELLKNAGYYTAQAGKWHMGEYAKRGFDVAYDKSKDNGDGGEEMWVKTLQQRPKQKPFFMWLASYDAHRPWGQNSFAGTNSSDNLLLPPYLADAENTRIDLAKHYDEVTRFDYYIGEVEAELKKQRVLDNTIIIIIGDNGRPFPRAKTRVYDSGMQTPLLIKWNKTIKPDISQSLISVIDIAPTILDVAGVTILPSFQGKSFKKIIFNPSLEFRKYVFSEHNWHDYEALERTVRTKDFLYVLNLRASLSNPGAADITSSPSFKDLENIRDSGKLSAAQADVFIAPRPFEELYDCRQDPMQLVNVASVKSYADQLASLRKTMAQWQLETKDSNPSQLTKDWYDRENGKRLSGKQIRGVMPGGEIAIKTNASGPF
jgi:arylsulfatase A-like enzyme